LSSLLFARRSLPGRRLPRPGRHGRTPAGSAAPALYKNCTNLNKRYPHGVGKRLARDKTSGEPVRNFRRSTPLYTLAMSHNRGLDRDKDGIACEQL
jgi:Excalibur calcium-binding domain